MLRSHFWTSCRVHCSGLCHEHRAGHPPREPAALCPCCGRDLQVDCPERHRMRCLRQRDGHQGVEQHLGEGSRLRRRRLRLEASHRPCSQRGHVSTSGASRVASKGPLKLFPSLHHSQCSSRLRQRDGKGARKNKTLPLLAAVEHRSEALAGAVQGPGRSSLLRFQQAHLTHVNADRKDFRSTRQTPMPRMPNKASELTTAGQGRKFLMLRHPF